MLADVKDVSAPRLRGKRLRLGKTRLPVGFRPPPPFSVFSFGEGLRVPLKLHQKIMASDSFLPMKSIGHLGRPGARNANESPDNNWNYKATNWKRDPVRKLKEEVATSKSSG